jgi:hypothetical protein
MDLDSEDYLSDSQFVVDDSGGQQQNSESQHITYSTRAESDGDSGEDGSNVGGIEESGDKESNGEESDSKEGEGDMIIEPCRSLYYVKV